MSESISICWYLVTESSKFQLIHICCLSRYVPLSLILPSITIFLTLLQISLCVNFFELDKTALFGAALMESHMNLGSANGFSYGFAFTAHGDAARLAGFKRKLDKIKEDRPVSSS